MTAGNIYTAVIFAAAILVLMVSFFAVKMDQKQKADAKAKADEAAAFVPANVPAEQFQAAAKSACTDMKGLSDFRICGTIVHGHCPLRSGKGVWAFDLDFNDKGHITGRYDRYSENPRSALPDYIGHLIQETLEEEYHVENVVFEKTDSKNPIKDPPGTQPNSFLMSLAAAIAVLLFLFVCSLLRK